MKVVRNRRIVKALACYLAMALFVIGTVEKLHAGFSPSEGTNLSSLDRSIDMRKIQNILEIKVVTERLRQLGFNKDEIQARLDQFSDQQLHKLALKVDELKVGGDDWGIGGLRIVAASVMLLYCLFLLVSTW